MSVYRPNTGRASPCVVNYVSNLPRNQRLGGWDGINAANAAMLSERYHLHYAGPIFIRLPRRRQVVNRIRRTLGLGETFAVFAEPMLNAYAKQADATCRADAAFDFFHGSTPWVRFLSRRPYFAYVDADFLTYLSVYHDRQRFRSADIERIVELERRWLQGASGVFFSSSWARRAAQNSYDYDASRFHVVGVGGDIAPPPNDTYEGGLDFLAVVTDFRRKGGVTSALAYQKVRERYPQATLTFVGVKPPAEILGMAGVRYAGYLNKSVAGDLQQLRALFASAFASILPSAAETTPVIIPEVGYFGCPTIAPARFGIPEMIQDGSTGILIAEDITPLNVSAAMLQLIDDPSNYLRMRSSVRLYATTHLTWNAVLAKLQSGLPDCGIRGPMTKAQIHEG